MAGVQGPETGQTPPTPEQAAAERVRAYIQQKAQQIREAFQRSVQEFKDKFNEVKPKADDVEQMEKADGEITGDPTDEATPTPKNKQVETGVWAQTTLDLIRSSDPANVDQFYTELGLNPTSKKILDRLSQDINPDHSVDEKGMTYLYKAIEKALNNNATSPLQVLRDEDFRNLAQLNPRLYQELTRAIQLSASQLGIDRREINRFIRSRLKDNPAQAAEISGQRGDYGEAAFLQLFSSREEPDATRALDLFEAIRSPNVEKFITYLDDYSASVIPEMQEARRREQEPEFVGDEIEIEARKYATLKIHETLEYMVNTIYATTLSQHADQNFKATAAEQGKTFANPDRIFNEAVSSKLIAMTSAVKDFEARNPSRAKDLKFFAYERKKTEYYDPKLKRLGKAEVPIANLEQAHFSHFAESLKEIATIEQGALSFGFNLMYIIHHPPGADKGGLFNSLKDFAAQNIKTETIDNLYILPHNEIIQAAVMSLDPMYKLLFAEHDWRKDPELETMLFEHLTPAEFETQQQLKEAFQGKAPQWAIDRAFYHARLMSFGKEFNFQLFSSYADPILTDAGKQTFKGEGVFAKNSTFDVFEGAKRWGERTDAFLYGLVTMPWNGFIKNFHPIEMRDKIGNPGWEDSLTHGVMSYFENKEFRDFNPMISRHNITRMGGVDGYGGWRMKYSYIHWLNNLIDVKTQGLETGRENDQMFVEGWKSIENIGTNVLKHYSEDFLSDPYDISLENFNKNSGKYKEFLKYLYTRYFSDGIGKSMYEGTGIENADQYWNHIHETITSAPRKAMTGATISDILRTHMYNALTVVLSERMPTEFISVEKRRSSQNGVTLQQELLEEFVHGENTPWSHNHENEQTRIKYWKEAKNDLVYVQQQARLESIKEMKKAVDHATRSGDPNKPGVLYGDLNSPTSSINYKIDGAYIERVLREKYARNDHGGQGNTDGAARVERAKQIYDSIMEKMLHKPKEGELEETWRREGNIKKVNQALAWTQRRSNWFAQNWKTYNFGMQFTSDTAGQFMNRSATGEETIARTAEACAVVAEKTKQYIAGGDFIKGMNGVVRNGRSKWGDLHEGIADVYSSIKIEDGDKAKEIVRHLANWSVIALRRDDRARGSLGRLTFQMEKRKTSLAAVKVDEGPAFDFDAGDIYDYNLTYTEKGILSQYTPEKGKFYREVPLEGIEEVLGKFRGKTTKFVRDYNKEVSGESVRKLNRGGKSEVFMESGVPILAFAMAAAIFIIVKKALDEETKK